MLVLVRKQYRPNIVIEHFNDLRTQLTTTVTTSIKENDYIRLALLVIEVAHFKVGIVYC